MAELIDKIPQEVQGVLESLQGSGFEAYIVGGCVRDLLRGVEPADWDVTTNADPGQIQKVFPDSYCDNKFGTVAVRAGKDLKTPMEIEVTPYRIESKYTDKRHPDEVEWAKDVNEDLGRRDFTINAIALSYSKKESKVEISVIDPYDGQKDLKDKIIRVVRNPNERFLEDALRMMRAVRFAATLGKDWVIETKTEEAVKTNAKWLKVISGERIRDELLKMVASPLGHAGIERLRLLGLLEYIMPELASSYNVGQNKHHIYDVYQHSVKSLEYADKKNFAVEVKLATLLHDIGKPAVKQGDGLNSTFYNHEIVGARVARKMLERLKFPKKEAEHIVLLVRYHLFYYNVGEVGESSVRRLVRKVGQENIEELMQVRQADRIGSGCPKAEPYKLRHLRYLMEKTALDPISAKMLKINGNELMKLLDITPGPKVGKILDVLLGYVLEDPAKNNKEFLEAQSLVLGTLTEKELESIAKKAEVEKETVETKRDEMTKAKYWVT